MTDDLLTEIRSHCHAPEKCDCWLCVLLRRTADRIEALTLDNAALTNIHACDINDIALLGLARDQYAAERDAALKRLAEAETAFRAHEAAMNAPLDTAEILADASGVDPTWEALRATLASTPITAQGDEK